MTKINSQKPQETNKASTTLNLSIDSTNPKELESSNLQQTNSTNIRSFMNCIKIENVDPSSPKVQKTDQIAESNSYNGEENIIISMSSHLLTFGERTWHQQILPLTRPSSVDLVSSSPSLVKTEHVSSGRISPPKSVINDQAAKLALLSEGKEPITKISSRSHFSSVRFNHDQVALNNQHQQQPIQQPAGHRVYGQLSGQVEANSFEK